MKPDTFSADSDHPYQVTDLMSEFIRISREKGYDPLTMLIACHELKKFSLEVIKDEKGDKAVKRVIDALATL